MIIRKESNDEPNSTKCNSNIKGNLWIFGLKGHVIKILNVNICFGIFEKNGINTDNQ